MNSKYVFPARIESIYDADTITVWVDLGFGIQFQGQKLRLYGINAYEVSLRGGTTVEEKAKGIEARDKLREMLPEDSEVLVETFKDSKGKYGRYLAKVYMNEKVGVKYLTEGWSPKIIKFGGQTWYEINQWLVESGYAVYKEY